MQASSTDCRWCHEKVEHGGRNMTLNEMRNSGYWIARANSLVRSIIFNCVPCRRLRATLAVQIMSNLPSERQSSEPPFTYVGKVTTRATQATQTNASTGNRSAQTTGSRRNLEKNMYLLFFLDIHNNNGVQQKRKVYSLGDCQSLYSSGIFLLKDIFHH